MTLSLKKKKKKKIGEGLILIIYHNFVILHMIYDLGRNMEKSEKKDYCSIVAQMCTCKVFRALLFVTLSGI